MDELEGLGIVLETLAFERRRDQSPLVARLRRAAGALHRGGRYERACVAYAKALAALAGLVESYEESLSHCERLRTLEAQDCQERIREATRSEIWWQDEQGRQKHLRAANVGRTGGKIGGHKRFEARYGRPRAAVRGLEGIIKRRWQQNPPEILPRFRRRKLAEAILREMSNRATLTDPLPTIRTIAKWLDGRWLLDLP
jgi:hypothetical protein